MNDLSWRARRAAARWLFVERRMELVGEEIDVRVAPVKLPLDGYYREVAKENPGVDYRRSLSVRSADALGFTRARTVWPTRTRELRVVEVKVSRSDLLSGIKKGQVGNGEGGLGSVGDFCHLLVPKGMRVDLGDVPARWGLLVFDPDARGSAAITIAKPARRLTPTVEVDEDRIARAIQQSVQWKLYDYGTTITLRRYSTGPNGYGWQEREVRPDGEEATA